MTAWANDEDYGEIFAQQLDNLINEGDIVIGISGSGKSENVIRALEPARRRGRPRSASWASTEAA